MYLDNSKKFVAVLNKKHPISTLMNALGHISSGLSGGNEHADDMKFLRYQNEAIALDSRISEYPFIVLSAKNNNQINTLRGALDEQGILHNAFVNTMLGASAKDQIDSTAEAGEEDIDFIAIALFGSANEIDPLTKKFSLFK